MYERSCFNFILFKHGKIIKFIQFRNYNLYLWFEINKLEEFEVLEFEEGLRRRLCKHFWKRKIAKFCCSEDYDPKVDGLILGARIRQFFCYFLYILNYSGFILWETPEKIYLQLFTNWPSLNPTKPFINLFASGQ